MDTLASKSSVKALRDALDKLSSNMGDTYREAIRRIEAQDEDDKKLAMRVLAWITHTLRPLKGMELLHALAVEAGQTDLDEEAIVDIDFLCSVCAGLVEVEETSGIIRLVRKHHAIYLPSYRIDLTFKQDYTTQEFFLQCSPHLFPLAHVEISRACLTYL